MKVGDIVHHKAHREMDMVVYEVTDADNVWCRWWNPKEHDFQEECFDPKELLFDGEQQQKPKTGGKDDN